MARCMAMVLAVLVMSKTLTLQAAGTDIAFPKVRPTGGSFPRPRQSEASTVTPPGFCWWRAGPEGKVNYRLIIRDAEGRIAYESRLLSDPVDVPGRTFAEGNYLWTVQVLDTGGKVHDTFGPRQFSIAPDAYEQPWVAPVELLASVPKGHPRLIFPKTELDAVRASLKTTRKEAFSSLKGSADRLLRLEVPPEKPQYQIHRLDRDVVQLKTKVATGQATVRMNLGVSPSAPAAPLEIRCPGADGKDTVLKTE